MANRAVLAIALLLFAALTASADKRKSDVIINFIVDPEIKKRFGTEAEFIFYLDDLVSRASLIFNADIGKRLKLGSVKINTPSKNKNAVEEPETLISWLKKQDDGSGGFLIFFTNTPFFDRSHNRLLGGYSEQKGNRLLLVEYTFETQRISMVILHQIGHLCGAEHSEGNPSIMSNTKNDSISFEEHIPIIRKNCGEK